MMRTNGPWDDRPREPRPVSRVGLYVWLALIVGGGLLIWELSRLFPGALESNNQDDVYLVRYVAILALVSSGLIYARRFDFRETARNFAIWTGIAAVLVLGYTYQDELLGVGQRVRSEFVPTYAVATGNKQVVLTQGDGGDFRVTGAVNGTPVTFLIDTGSSDVVLTPADAARLGIDLNALTFDRLYETANGSGLGATLTVDSLAVGPIQLENVKVSVNRAPMRNSLLGMSFLRRLKSFEFRGRQLYLRAP